MYNVSGSGKLSKFTLYFFLDKTLAKGLKLGTKPGFLDSFFPVRKTYRIEVQDDIA